MLGRDLGDVSLYCKSEASMSKIQIMNRVQFPSSVSLLEDLSDVNS